MCRRVHDLQTASDWVMGSWSDIFYWSLEWVDGVLNISTKGAVVLGDKSCNLSSKFVAPLWNTFYEMLHSVTTTIKLIKLKITALPESLWKVKLDSFLVPCRKHFFRICVAEQVREKISLSYSNFTHSRNSC